MSHQLEKLLETKCIENSDASVLQSQWDFDRRLLQRSLQAVGFSYPHYSRHDASHSQTILVLVERLLGRTGLEKLSATDIWLLLEAAYLHDSGMIISQRQFEETWMLPEFRSFLETLSAGADRELGEFASLLLNKPDVEVSNSTPDVRWPLRVAQAVRITMAEYRRRQHPEASKNIVLEPGSIGIFSPRTELIPDRLFRWLGEICAAHGKSFDEVMELPRIESGVAQDDAHPRFIACLLRLGDLLDLDNGRFCPTMLRCAGPLTASSRAHVEKHASIRHLVVTSEVIEVDAEFSSDQATDQAYQECEAWLRMLREELARQQARWSQIVPAGDFGPLPSAGRIAVRVRNLVSLGQLEIDAPKVTKLLQGANFYKSTGVYVREVLQNAVDATLIRVWLEKRDDFDNPPEHKELLLLARDLLNQWPIDITVEQMGKSASGDKQRWRFKIVDRGVGISRHDIEYMRKIGSSAKNPVRHSLIQSMPEWLRPAGAFGIGLQSLFLVTAEVRIISRSSISGEAIRVRLVRGDEQLRPTILVESPLVDREEAHRSVHLPFGATVEFDLEADSIPTRISWPKSNTEKNRIVRSFDAVVDRDMPILAAEIEEQLTEFAECSWVPIRFQGKEVHARPEQGRWHLDTSEYVRTKIEYHPNLDGWIQCLYRGAPVSDEHLRAWQHLLVTADIVACGSDDVLTLNRQEFRRETRDQTSGRIRRATERAIVADLKRGDIVNKEHREALSLAAHLSADPEVSKESGQEWREICLANTGWKLGAITERATVKVLCFPQRADEIKSRDWSVSEASAELEISGGIDSWRDLLERVLLKELPHRQLCAFPSNEGEPRPSVVRFRKHDFDDVVENDQAFREIMRNSCAHWLIGARRNLPCRHRFRALALRPDAELPWVNLIEPRYGLRMLSPFTVPTDEGIEITEVAGLVKCVVANSQEASDRRAVAATYAEFVRYVDALMVNDEEWRKNKKYDVELAVAEFKRAGDAAE